MRKNIIKYFVACAAIVIKIVFKIYSAVDFISHSKSKIKQYDKAMFEG